MMFVRFFGDTLISNNIPYEVMLAYLSFIFDRPIIYKIIKHTDQSNNNFQCVLGFNASRFGKLIAHWSVETLPLRRIWRYQSGNQNPYTEEEQTTQ